MAGASRDSRIAMIATTTNNSTSVKPGGAGAITCIGSKRRGTAALREPTIFDLRSEIVDFMGTSAKQVASSFIPSLLRQGFIIGVVADAILQPAEFVRPLLDALDMHVTDRK